MSSEENQGDDGCVTVEYSTEEKQELYDVEDEANVDAAKATHGGVIAWMYEELIEK